MGSQYETSTGFTTVPPPEWAQEAYIKAANNDAQDYFGHSVSLDNDTLAVGVQAEDSNQTTITNGTSASSDDSRSASGAVYVYKRTGTSWAQEAYIKAANLYYGDNFGFSVALDSDTLAVGAINEDSNQTTITNGTSTSSDDSLSDSGAVYVYKRTGTSWAQEAYIKAVNSSNGDQFGSSVALDKNTLAVGAVSEDSNQTAITNGTSASSNNSNSQSGAVYVYKRTGTSWAQEAYIKAANNDPDDYFGHSVALDSDTLAVVARQEESNQTTITNGTSASSDNSIAYSGAVYVYKRTGTSWAQEAYIKSANNEDRDQFTMVALSGDTLAVGAYGEDSNQTTITNGTSASSNNSNSESGAVFVYKRTGTSWAQEAYIKAANNDAQDYFGYSVALDNNTLAVGASSEDSNQTMITNGTSASSDDSRSASGAVYVYKRNTDNSSWAQESYIKAANNDADDGFYKVTLSGDTLAVTAESEDSNQTTITNGTSASSNNSNDQSGAVYVYLVQ